MADREEWGRRGCNIF